MRGRNASSASPRSRPRRCTRSASRIASSASAASPCARRSRARKSRRSARSPAPRSARSSSCSRISSSASPTSRPRSPAELIRHGVEVWISNHRSVDGILDYVRRLGALVGAADTRQCLRRRTAARARRDRAEAARLPRRPKVYFEEWDEPPITGIRWVAELVRIAGGDDMFPERALESLAKQRILDDSERSRARVRRTSSSVRGAARNSARRRSPRARAGMRFRRCAMASCTRSSRRSSCSRGRRR